MNADDFYRLRAPSVWRTTVEMLSYSSLKTLETCPRQWQLLRSEWPGFKTFPQRKHRAAIEGTLVHEMLDKIFRAMALAGLPRPGSPVFREVIAEVDILGVFRAQIEVWNAELEGHPRAASLRLQSSERTMYNKVSILFQIEYASVQPTGAYNTPASKRGPVPEGPSLSLLVRRGVSTECPVAHPTLPVRGVIDLVRRDTSGTHIVDFKTGAPRPEYRDQLLLYALMWWRSTGDLPTTVELRHPCGRTESPVSQHTLEALEASLSKRIEIVRTELASAPAGAVLGEHCERCDVRPFCDPYWAKLAEPEVSRKRAMGEFIDVELAPTEPMEPNGFTAQTRSGRSLPVVYDDECAAQHGPFVTGERLRVLGALMPSEHAELRLTRSSEVFRSPR